MKNTLFLSILSNLNLQTYKCAILGVFIFCVVVSTILLLFFIFKYCREMRNKNNQVYDNKLKKECRDIDNQPKQCEQVRSCNECNFYK
jgi:hypothetical protein